MEHYIAHEMLKNGTVYFPFLSPSWYIYKPINSWIHGTHIKTNEI